MFNLPPRALPLCSPACDACSSISILLMPFYSCGIIGGRRKTNESVRNESKLWCGSLPSVIRCGWGNGGTPLLLLLLASLVSLWVVHVPQLLCLDLLVLTVLHVRKEAARDGSMGGL